MLNVPFCSPDLEGNGNREARPLRSRALSLEDSWRIGRWLRSSEECDRLRETGRQGQGGNRRDRHGRPQLPGWSNAPFPHTALPQGKVLPLGTDWFGSHWPGSWYRGRKGSSGKGALRRSTPRSRSIQHCGEGQGHSASLSREPSLRALPLPTASPYSSFFPFSIHLAGGRWDLVLIFHLWANKVLLRKQR